MEEKAGVGENFADRVRRRILAVGMEPELYGRIEALLNRSYFEVDKVPRGESGQVLCAAIAFDLVLVRFPLPDIAVTDLLAEVRMPGSPCFSCQVVLLADEPNLSEAGSLVGQGANAALATDKTGEFLNECAARLLQVAPRIASRMMVRLKARIGDGDRQSFCQTGDLSVSGMFVRTDESYPLGSTLSYELMLPQEREPVFGTAVVVRHAVAGEGKHEGIGLRYVEFRAGSEARLHAYIERTSVST
jgi:hypothetical protein